jgi:phage terminase large subunit-like protein
MWPTPTEQILSLGWALVDLIEQDLRIPTGVNAGKPLVLTNEQVDLIVAWYEVNPRGDWVYRRGAFRLPKKWSKSPIAAAIAYCELVGPCRFSHFGEDGQPVGMPHPSPWIQIAACSEDQTDNTFMQLFEMLRGSPAVAERGLDVGLTRIKFRGQPGIIEPVTSSADSREGQPITFAILDETGLWNKENSGKALAATLRRNTAPLGARTIETTNAFVPGEGSVAEATHESVSSGRAAGVLYVAREAPAIDISNRDTIDRVQLIAALDFVYGDSGKARNGWVDTARLADEFFDTTTDLAEAARFYLNQIVAPSEALVDLTIFAQLVDADARLVQGDVVALGFDGSDTGDCTALYACRWPDYLVVPLGVWERPERDDQGWRVPRAEVDAAVRSACDQFKVIRGYFDPPQWQTEIDSWSGEFGASVMRFPHASDQRIGPACERFASMVEQRTLRHTGEPVLIRHLANARRGQAGTKWWRPARKHAGRPIDAASAAISAVHALGEAVALGELEQKPKKTDLRIW